MIRALSTAAFVAAAAGVVFAPVAAAEAPFRNCTEARKAGYTNIPATSDYYGSHLDRDGDGIGCES